MNKAKKKQAKAFKGTENESDLKESFGVNEDVEDQIETLREEDQLNRIKTLKSQLMNQVQDAEIAQQYGGDMEEDGEIMQATSGLAQAGKGKKNAYAVKSKKELREQMEKLDKMEASKAELQRERDAAGLEDESKITLMPKYEKDHKLNIDREINVPPESIYIGLGWDADANSKRKHYRMYYNTELEKVKEIFMDLEDNPDENAIASPFHRFDLRRGQKRGLSNASGLFSFLKTSAK